MKHLPTFHLIARRGSEVQQKADRFIALRSQFQHRYVLVTHSDKCVCTTHTLHYVYAREVVNTFPIPSINVLLRGTKPAQIVYSAFCMSPLHLMAEQCRYLANNGKSVLSCTFDDMHRLEKLSCGDKRKKTFISEEACRLAIFHELSWNILLLQAPMHDVGEHGCVVHNHCSVCLYFAVTLCLT